MPLKPLDKHESKKTEIKPEKQKKPISKSKVIIIGVVVLFGLVFSKFIVLKPIKIASSLKTKDSPDTSRLKSDVRKQTGSLLAKAQREASQMVGQILGENTKNLSKIATSPAQTVSDYVVDQAVASILAQIKKLPQHQQDIIRTRMCK